MSKLLQRVILFFLMITSCGLVHGQNEEQIPLALVLSQIEKRHNVRFSYEAKTIEGINITCLLYTSDAADD